MRAFVQCMDVEYSYSFSMTLNSPFPLMILNSHSCSNAHTVKIMMIVGWIETVDSRECFLFFLYRVPEAVDLN